MTTLTLPGAVAVFRVITALLFAAGMGGLATAADWRIVDAVGHRVADVVQSSASFQQTSYAVTAGGEELCRLAAVMGATAATAEVQIEFLPASDGRFNRSLAIALAPLIEDRTRRQRWA